MPILKIQNTDYRGRKILVLHPDASHVEDLTASFDEDQGWTGLNVYGTSDLDEARKLVREHAIDLAIFPEEVAGKDFVTVQQALLKANPNIKMIPCLGVPNLAKIRESNRAGGVVDFGDIQALASPEELKKLVQVYFRDQAKESLTAHKQLAEETTSIQRALLIDHPEWVAIKEISAGIVGVVISNFDISTTQASAVMGAERLFVPWLTAQGIEALLQTDSRHLRPILSATGTWMGVTRKPTSSEGMIITATNMIADAVAGGKSDAEINELIKKRPEALLHRAIRTLDDTALSKVLERASDFRNLRERTG